MRIVASPAPRPRSSSPGADNAARIHEIRALLDAGAYAIDLDELASRIVDDEVMRIRRSSGV